ncbi:MULTISPECIES: hypothetical protein [Peribacillus]|uniref:Uncharacterized protein n=1 Tax=Peribacillus simplex TaxID=1478 RepID=A0A9W4KPI1_9BACI|nr:hypothetical protein [Peribacillus simplex]MDR4926439.1 hypothetical protein [Peribacillus simplex]WHX93592.1 hypothetical protein QNH50_12565 [Peribacillus simplex]CAH0169042.1 hypothetical protein SRABI133_01137 [Peribacillus simplex]
MQRITLRKTRTSRTRGCFGLWIIVQSVWEFCHIDFDLLNTIPNPETNEITVSLSGVYEKSADLVVITNELETALFTIN